MISLTVLDDKPRFSPNFLTRLPTTLTDQMIRRPNVHQSKPSVRPYAYSIYRSASLFHLSIRTKFQFLGAVFAVPKIQYGLERFHI